MKRNIRGSGQVDTVGNSVGEDLRKIPAVRSHRGQDTIDGEGHDSTIVEQRNDQHHERREIELVGEREDGEADDDTDGDSTGVDGVIPHALEDDTGSADGVDDGGQTGLSEDDVSGTAGGVGGTLNGNTDVGTGESGSVVGTITSHGDEMAECLETLDNLVLVLGEDTSETVGVEDHVIEGSVLSTGGGAVLENLGGVHVVTKSKTTSSLLCDSELITGNHLNLDTEGHGVVDSLLGILTGRVEDGEETDELEAVALLLVIVSLKLLVCNSERTETTGCVFLNVSLEPVLEVLGLVAGAEFDDDTGHALGDTLELAGGLLAVGDLGTLVGRVERLEVEQLNAGTCAGNVTNGLDNGQIDSVLVLGTGSVCSEEDDIVGGEGAVGLDSVTIDGELVGGKGTGLVRAQDGDTGQLLNGSDTGDNSLVLGELLGTDGEGDGQDGGHGNGDTTNQEDQDVVETATVIVTEAGVEDEDFSNDEDTDGDEAERPNLGKNLLQMTGGVIVLADEGRGTTEESVGTGGDDNTLSFTLFASRATDNDVRASSNTLQRDNSREALVTELLALGQGLAGKSSLIDRDVDSLGQTAVGGDDVSNLEGDHVTGNESGRLDLGPGTVTLALGLGGKGVHESLDGISGVALLVETDTGVDEQQEDDTDEILPVWRAVLTVGECDSDEGGALHHPGQGVPHETQEL